MGTQVWGISQPLLSNPVKQGMWSNAQTAGHMAAHWDPSLPIGPFLNWNIYKIYYVHIKQSLKPLFGNCFQMYFFKNSLPVIGMQLAGIGHPFASNPPGHIIWFSGQFDTVKGQETGHSFPSKPIGPISKRSLFNSDKCYNYTIRHKTLISSLTEILPWV